MTCDGPVAKVQQDRLEYQDAATLHLVPASPMTNVALGAFLRSRRERLSPEALGLAASGRRRTPGLRRDEVAELAGISVEWLTKLEQGRAVAPPLATADALARALLLSEVDRAHLRRLAGGRTAPFARERVPSGLRALLAGMAEPAYVTGRRWDLLAWNAAAARLFDFGALPPERRNILHFVLTDSAAKTLFGTGWATEARRLTALFRATFDLFADDPAFVDLVAQVTAGCDPFKDWWSDHDVRAPVSGTKTLHRPDGPHRYRYASFQCNDDPALKLAMYTPC